MLDRSTSGQNDLDLLIEKTDSQRFEEIIQHLGFKEAVALHQEQLPGIAHYYALDSKSGQLVHLHRHYQLIIGHDLTKNYHLPLETPFIRLTIQHGFFRVPAPELEFIAFVIRMILKRPLLDRHRRRTLGPYESSELTYLQTLAHQERLNSLLQTYLPQMSVELWQKSLRSLQPSCPWWERTRISWILRQVLRIFRRRPLVLATALKIWRRYSGTVRARLNGTLPRKIIAHGGSIVAIVGGDGAGKSTTVQAIAKWLARDFEVLQTHMGKPPRMWITSVVEFVIKVVSFARKLLIKDVNTSLLPDSRCTSWFGFLLMLHPICIARDRLRLYFKMRRFALRGGIVICDRYYLPWIKLMDGPKLGHLPEIGDAGHLASHVSRLLIKIEKWYYQRISPPDLLLVLKVNPDIAIQRKPDEDAGSVRRRSREIWDLDWGKIPAHVIDASESLTEVLSKIKTIVWQGL